jgi:hypothetical protein
LRDLTHGRGGHAKPNQGSKRYGKSSHIFKAIRDLKGAFFGISGPVMRRAFFQEKIENIIKTPSFGVNSVMGSFRRNEVTEKPSITRKKISPRVTHGAGSEALEEAK